MIYIMTTCAVIRFGCFISKFLLLLSAYFVNKIDLRYFLLNFSNSEFFIQHQVEKLVFKCEW